MASVALTQALDLKQHQRVMAERISDALADVDDVVLALVSPQALDQSVRWELAARLSLARLRLEEAR